VTIGQPRPKLILAAGPGWDQIKLLATVQLPTELAEAVSLISGG